MRQGETKSQKPQELHSGMSLCFRIRQKEGTYFRLSPQKLDWVWVFPDPFFIKVRNSLLHSFSVAESQDPKVGLLDSGDQKTQENHSPVSSTVSALIGTGQFM
jgi:hypothetical protein